MTPKKPAWAAVRNTEGREWIDINTLEVTADLARSAASVTDALIPLYAADNPVVRIVRVEVGERRWEK